MAIFVPEIFADAVNEKLGVTLRIGSIAFDATSLVPEVLSAGDSVNFPKFDRVADVVILRKTVA